MSEEVKQQDQNESGKIGKKFEENIKKLIAVVGGEKPLKRQRVAKDAVGTLVTELLKEKTEALGKKLKDDLGTLIEAKVGFDKAVVEEEKKLAKFKEERMKEFNQKAEALFSQIDGIDQLSKDYYSAITTSDVAKGDARPA